MNPLHLFVKFFGGSFYDENTGTLYHYRGSINLLFIGLWLDVKLWCVLKYYP